MKYDNQMQKKYTDAVLFFKTLNMSDEDLKTLFSSVPFNFNYLKLHNRFVVDGKIKEK